MTDADPVPKRSVAEIRLSLPLEPDWIALARTTGAAVASRADFTYEQIADLRLAIDELCLSLLERAGAAGRINLIYTLADDVLLVDAEIAGGGRTLALTSDSAAHEFSERILDALVDEHGSDFTGSTQQAWLRKRRSAINA